MLAMVDAIWASLHGSRMSLRIAYGNALAGQLLTKRTVETRHFSLLLV